MYYTVDSFDYSKISAAGVCIPRRRKSKRESAYQVKNLVCSFDIETSRHHYRTETISGRRIPRYQSYMYIWMFAVETDVIIGRTWDEYKTHVQRIEECLGEYEKLLVFVHNLSYEFQFLSGIFDFRTEDVFALDRRRVAKAVCGSLEYRCSYIHSNMSLQQWADKMRVAHRKKSGDLAYTIERYPWTELTPQELQYCMHDVLAVVECIHADMTADHDELCDIPLTNTGYVRRDCKAAMRDWARWNMEEIKPDLALWEICREAFRGGDTHANRYYSGVILDNVKSVDRSSSYPDVMCNELFPMSAFQHHAKPSLSALIMLIKKRRRACIFRARIRGLRLRDVMNGFPYLPISKCRHILNPVNDNGRVLSADYLEISLTDIDWKIVVREYDWDNIDIYDIWSARYGLLPEPLRKTLQDYYERKTALKGVEGEEVYYLKSKNKLNSGYGMAAQNPVKHAILFNDGAWSIDDSKTDQELLDEYNSKAFLAYQWGVWVTAHARYQLREMLWRAGDGAVYCDTDSVKHVGVVDWTAYNKERLAKSQESGSYAADKSGRVYYMGVADPDGVYQRFVTWGAKKYAYEDKGGLHITVAGVNKKKGAAELAAAGGLEAFKPGFVFRAGGGSELVYNDFPDIDHITVDGRRIEITRNVVILDSEYTLGITGEYMDILRNGKFILQEIARKY